MNRLLIRPEDLPEHVFKNIDRYRSSMLRLLEDHMADHDQQYLVELDGNQPVAVLEKVTLLLNFRKNAFEFTKFLIFCVTVSFIRIFICRLL